MLAKDVMSIGPVTVSPDHGIRHAIQIMLDRKISGVPVVDDEGCVVGMLTEGDLLSRSELGMQALLKPDPTSAPSDEARRYMKSNGWRVADVMSADLVVVDTETPITQIAALLVAHSIKRVPVLSQGRLVGIVSRADLLATICACRPEETAAGDEAIERSVSTRLGEKSHLLGEAVTAAVHDGVVHLSGTVPSDETARLARVIAESIPGVNGVKTDLAVIQEERP